MKPDVSGDDYLDVGNEVGDLALVYDWCFSGIDDKRKAAWLAYADQAVWNVWHFDMAKWGSGSFPWDGWAVDDPSDNYYYSFLRATMLLGLAAHDEIPDAAGWLTEFHDTKLVGELIPTFDKDLVGGGSREGTGYGTAMGNLFVLYDLWQGSTGENIAVKTPHTRASMLAFLHQMVPTLDRFAPTGDQARDSTASFYDYQRTYMLVLAHLFPKDPLAPRVQAAGGVVPAGDERAVQLRLRLRERQRGHRAFDARGPGYDVLRARHRPGLHTLRLGRPRDVAQPHRRVLHPVARPPGSGLDHDLQGRVAGLRRHGRFALRAPAGGRRTRW